MWSATEPMGLVLSSIGIEMIVLPVVGSADPVLAVLRVAEVVDGGDGYTRTSDAAKYAARRRHDASRPPSDR
jgi:hypothetical protein